VLFLFLQQTNAQCLGSQSHTITPAGPYSPGQTVTVSYTLNNFVQLNINWIHCFDLDLGPGWISAAPIVAPGNPGGSSGSWIWDTQHLYPSGINFGPGWRFNNTSTPAWGTSSTGPFTMSFQLTADSLCSGQDLHIIMEAYGDCQTGGWSNGACCPINGYSIYSGTLGSAGSAGIDNNINKCDSDPTFDMTTQLGGNPLTTGTWYDPIGNITSQYFNPSTDPSGIYLYVIQGFGAGCPNDSAYLTINVNTLPIVNLTSFPDMCDYDTTISLNSGTPAGGSYSVNGNNSTTFTPSNSNIGLNIITYTYTDANGCSNSISKNLYVNESPSASANTTNASCNGFFDGTAILNINGGLAPYDTNWYGFNPLSLSAGSYTYSITDSNNCVFTDSIIIYEPSLVTTTINTIDVTCYGGNNGSAAVYLQGTTTPPGTVSLLNYCTSQPGSNMNSTIDNVELIGDNVSISNNTTGICDQYEDYSPTQYADITQGQAYNIDITLGDCSPNNYPSAAKIYIDWNIDGDFNDIGELVGTIPLGTPSTTSIGFVVPFSGFGATRMRIVSQFLNNMPVDSIGPCDIGYFSNPTYTQPWFGATEDYSIVISSPGINATYLWSNGATTDSISSLSAGVYNVNITDDFGCVITDTAFINEPNQMIVNTLITNNSCFGVDDGSVELTILGGTPNYTISFLNYSQILNSGSNIFSTPNIIPAGTYNYSISDSNNCIYNDSITIISPPQITTNTSITACDSYLWNNVYYNSSLIITDTLNSYNNCDSIVTLDLTVNTSDNITENITECDSYTWDGVTLNNSGIYSNTYTNAIGCDSTHTINLTINYSSYANYFATNCDAYTWNLSAQTYTTSGIYYNISTNNDGCTHVDSLFLLINNSNMNYDTVITCNTYYWNNNTYTQSGDYMITLNTTNGCDSTINLNLTIEDTTGSLTYATACDSYIWALNGNTFSTSGLYTEVSYNSLGCPHVDSLYLTINNSQTTSSTITRCDNYTWDGVSYTISGMYTNTYINTSGCDSIHTLNLIINNSNSYTDNITACNSYTWLDGVTYTSSNNNATTNYINTNGCDSTIYLNLIILSENAGSATIISCDSFDWNGQIIYNSGIYNQTLTNQYGCDSIATLNLTISDTTGSLTYATACDSYFWGIDGNTYNISGTYTNIGNNINGCIHIDSLILIINSSTSSYTNINSCNSYNWGGAIYTNSGVYTYSTMNNSGCDSLATLNLIINTSDTTDIAITECEEYSWNGMPPYTVSGIYTQNLFNQNGCDSIVRLNLTIINSSNNVATDIIMSDISCHNLNDGSIQLISSGGVPPYSYLWSNGSTNSYINNLSEGIYTFTITDNIGCNLDSNVIITNPEAIEASFSCTKDTICKLNTTEIIIDILNPKTNLYTVIIEDSIQQQTYVVDSLGRLMSDNSLILLTPNYNTQIEFISITDEYGCTTNVLDSILITVHPLPILEINLNDQCANDEPIILSQYDSSIVYPLGGVYFIDGINTNIFNIENSINKVHTIRYEYIDSITNCFNFIEKDVTILPSPIASFDFSPQPANMEDPNIYFRNKNEDIINCIWDLGDSTIINNTNSFTHTYTKEGKYIIKYIETNSFSCSDTLIDSLIINPMYTIFIASAFSPNGDDINEYFPWHPENQDEVLGNHIKNYEMYIYNNWGENIFDSENIVWDGKVNGKYVQKGVYMYSIIITDFKDKDFKYTGSVHLIR